MAWMEWFTIYIGKRTRKASYKSVYNVLALVYQERKCKIYIVFAYCCMMNCRRNEPEINENGGGDRMGESLLKVLTFELYILLI